MSITWEPHQPPSGDLPITALLTIKKAENDDLLLRMISCPQSNSSKPSATVRVLSLLAFTRTYDPMPPSVLTVVDISFKKTVFSKTIYHLSSARLSIGISNKQDLLTHFIYANFDVMHNVITFRAQSTAPFAPPKTNCIRCSNIDLPL